MVVIAALLVGCDPSPSPAPTQGASQPTLGPTSGPTTAPPSPSPTPAAPATGPFPLAVVTGLTNLKSWTTLNDLGAMALGRTLTYPCGLVVTAPAKLATTPGLEAPGCLPADQIAVAIADNPELVALLPAGLVEPTTKVLPIGGDGPFGLGGADLFGAKEDREQPYPITAEPLPGTSLLAAWTAHDAANVWTLTSLGGSCLDRNVAYAALELGYGWDWVMDGGTARYRSIHRNRAALPPGVSRELVVDAVATGNRGAVPRLVSTADVTVDDFDCTLNEKWRPNYGRALVFSTDADVLPLLRNKLGFDVMKLAGNHATDYGERGQRTTLRLLDEAGIVGVGVGSDLDAALEPGYLDVAGVKVAFVSWNAVPGSREATEDGYGVAWLRRANVIESVRRARAAGADLVFCTPEWWGGAEYHMDVRASQQRQLGWMDEAGCDHILGHGTHLAGPMLLRPEADPARAGLVMVSQGNYLFGQNWWQEVQEGVILEASFSGTRLVNVRLHPYIMLEAAQASLTDPEGDGHYALERLWKHSEIEAAD